MQSPQFNIYPSLLIKFQDLLDYELVAEEGWNKVGDDYKLTPDEMYDKIERELIDTINRAPKGPMEAADKGTAFNEIVDCLIENRGSSREDCLIGSMTNKKGERIVRAQINGFTFDYSLELCRETADFFKGSIPQYTVEAVMPTSRGNVRLYGVVDEWVGAHMYDLKTTGSYSFGKFEKGWQRHVYPWCAIESGLTDCIQAFHYAVVEWKKNSNPLQAKFTGLESYDYNHQESGRKIRDMLEIFLDWLMAHRDQITDRKIFNQQ